MRLDVRIPIGLTFSVFGVILTSSGVMANSDGLLYGRPLSLNANLGWGLVLLVFGGLTLLLVYLGKKKTPDGK